MSLSKPNRDVRALLTFGGLAVLAGAVSALVAYATAAHGAGFSPDSVAYLSLAHSLRAGDGYAGYGAGTYPMWPPLYPLFLAVIDGISGVDPRLAMRWVNVVLSGLIVGAAGALLLASGIRSRLLVLGGAVMVACSVPLVDVARWAWTEPLFVLLLILFLTSLFRYLDDPGQASLVWPTLFAALACSTRYIGVTLIASGALAIVLLANGPRRTRWWDAFRFALAASLPTLAWMARNLVVAGTLAGRRREAQVGLRENVALTIDHLLAWLLPSRPAGVSHAEQWHPGVTFGMTLGLSALVVVAFGTVLIRAWVGRSPRDRQDAAFCLTAALRDASSLRNAAALVLFVSFYVLLLVAMASVAAFDPIGHRLLSPIYVPLVALGVMAVAWGLSSLSGLGARRLATAVVSLLFGWWLIQAVPQVGSVVRISREEGLGFASRTWSDSPLVRHLRNETFDPATITYTNVPDALYFYTGRLVRWSPQKHGRRGKDLATVRREWPAGEARLVWFDEADRSFLYAPDELTGALALSPIRELADGTVYRIAGATR